MFLFPRSLTKQLSEVRALNETINFTMLIFFLGSFQVIDRIRLVTFIVSIPGSKE